MKKFSSYLLVPALVFSVGTTMEIHTVSAQSANDIQSEINDLHKQKGQLNDKKNSLQNNKQEAESKINQNLNKQQSVEEQLDSIEDKLGSTKKDLVAKEQAVQKTNEQLDQLKVDIQKLHKEIETLKKRIKKREEILKNRLQAIQQDGGNIKYLEVLMGSQDIGDFINRSASVNTIMEQDKSIMDELDADKKKLQEKKEKVEEKKEVVATKKEHLVSQKKELEGLKQTLDSQKTAKDRLMATLEKEHKHLEDYKVSLEDEQEILAAQETALQKAITMAEGKKGELEQQARDNAKQQATGNAGSSSGGSSSHATPATGGSGVFSWPAQGRISSGYGHRWGTLHAGLDIANSTGTPVKAAAPGVVISTNTPNDGKMNGYGNVVLIAHSINGTTYTTLYAHMSKISVSAGQHVNTGDLVGAIGSTGQSTGPHLYFEVHRGGWNAAKSNSLDPATVLP